MESEDGNLAYSKRAKVHSILIFSMNANYKNVVQQPFPFHREESEKLPQIQQAFGGMGHMKGFVVVYG